MPPPRKQTSSTTFFAAKLLEVPLQLGLGEGRRDVELAPEAHGRRNVPEGRIDRRDPDRREHRVAIGIGEGRGKTLVLEHSAVLVGGEQLVALAGVREADPDQPAGLVRVVVLPADEPSPLAPESDEEKPATGKEGGDGRKDAKVDSATKDKEAKDKTKDGKTATKGKGDKRTRSPPSP